VLLKVSETGGTSHREWWVMQGETEHVMPGETRA
jgi:hypothetical protein